MASSIRGTLGWRHRAGKGGKPPVNRAHTPCDGQGHLRTPGFFFNPACRRGRAFGGKTLRRRRPSGNEQSGHAAATGRQAAHHKEPPTPTTTSQASTMCRCRGFLLRPGCECNRLSAATRAVPAPLALELSMERSCSCSRVVKCVRRGPPLPEGEGPLFRLRQEEGGRGSNQ